VDWGGDGYGNKRVEVDCSRDGSVGRREEESLALQGGWKGESLIGLGGVFEV